MITALNVLIVAFIFREEEVAKKTNNLSKKRSSVRSKLPRSRVEEDNDQQQTAPAGTDHHEAPVQQIISIEARLLPKLMQPSAHPSHHPSQDPARSSTAIEDEDGTENDSRRDGGVLIGKIELRDRIDKILFGGHKMKSYFESVKDLGGVRGSSKKLPTLRIFKEIVFNSTY